MKKFILSLCLLAPLAHAQEETCQTTEYSSKKISLIQEQDAVFNVISYVTFADKAGQKIPLSQDEGQTRSAKYLVSPNEKWIAQCQQVDNRNFTVYLYELKDTRKIIKIESFEDGAWKAAKSLFKPNKFESHSTVMSFVSWSPDSKSITCKLNKYFEKTEIYHSALVTYNLETKKYTAIKKVTKK